MNEKMNSNSMRNMYKNNTLVLIQERARLNVSKNLTICSLMVVFWANVMNERWQINNLIYFYVYSKTHKLILKSNSCKTSQIVAFTQVKSVEHMTKKSISNAHFVVFLSHRCQNVENVHETFIKRAFLWSPSTECTSNVFRNLAALVGSKQAKCSDPPCRKQGWIPRKTIS